MNQFNTRPLYLQVFDLLAARITSGEWPKDQAIPNEFDLSQQLNVSIGTLRKGVEALVAAKMVVRRQGRGTFVTDRLSPEIHNIFDPIRKSDGSYIAWQWTMVRSESGEATPMEQARLSLPSGGQVTRFTRIGSIDGRPARFEVSTTPVSRFGDVSNLTADQTKIVALCYRLGIILGKVAERINIRGVSNAGAEALHLSEGTPILSIRRIVFDNNGVPIEWSISECHLVNEYYSSPTVGLSQPGPSPAIPTAAAVHGR